MNKHTRRCCVLNCRNSNYKILSKTKTKLFKFPRNVNRCRDWVCAIRDPSVASCTWETLITHGYVCKDHFEEKYVTAIQGITVNAVPTIFPYLRTPLSEPQLRLFDESVPVQKSALGFEYYERVGSNVKDPTINQNPIMHNIVVEAEIIIKLEEVNFELLKEAKVGSHVEEPIMIKNPIKDDIVVEAESIIKLEEVKEEPNDYVESSWTFLGEVQPPVPLMEPKEEVAEVKQEEEVEAQTSLPLLEPMEEVAEIKQEEEELDPPAAVFIKCGTGEIQAEGEGPLAPCNDDNSVDSPLQKARYLCPIEGVFKLAEEEETSGRTTSDKSTGSSSEDDDDHGSHDNQDDHDEEEEEGASEDTVKKSVLARFGSRTHVACKSHYDPLVKRRVVELALSGECSVSAAARRCGRKKMAACSNSSEQQEAFVRLNLLETRFTCLEESVNRAVGTLMPKVEDLLSERFQGGEATSSSSPPAAAAPSSSLLELAERGDCEALLRMLADEGDDVRCNPPRAANGDTALHVAASGGQLKAVMVLLGAGARVGDVDHRLRTPLHCAAARGHLAVAQRLLDAGARDDAKDADDAVALELAARNGFSEVVRLLLQRGSQTDVKSVTSAISQGNKDLLDVFLQNGVSVDACDESGKPLLVRAAEAKRWEMVKFLLEKGASATKSRGAEECALVFASEGGQADAVHHLLRRGAASNAEQVRVALKKAKSAAVVWAFVDAVPQLVKGEAGGQGLMEAAKDGRLETMIALLEMGLNVNFKNINETALSLASSNGQIACVRELLRKGAEPKSKGKCGWTPLHDAASGGHVECVRELLSQGADVNAKNSQEETPLHVASAKGNVECLRELVDRGAGPEVQDNGGWTALHSAATGGDVECVRELLMRGANPDVHDHGGWTPLHSAATGRDVECVRELLARSANPNVQDKDGWTPLHIAASGGHAECVLELLARGTDVNTKNEDGQTPLHIAASEGHAVCVQELLARGAKANVKDKDGQTPLQNAASGEHAECLRELLSHGSDVNVKNTNGWTLLYRAASEGHAECITALLVARASAAERNKGQRALKLTCTDEVIGAFNER